MSYSKCTYIFTKGLNKGNKCSRINCRIHGLVVKDKQHEAPIYDYIFRVKDIVSIAIFQTKFLDIIIDFEIDYNDETPEYSLSFSSYKTLDEVRSFIKTVNVEEMMIKTLNYRDNYDGEEWFEEDDVKCKYPNITNFVE